MAIVVGAWWAQPSMPPWWGEPRSIGRSHRVKPAKHGAEGWRSQQTMSDHLSDPLGVDPSKQPDAGEKNFMAFQTDGTFDHNAGFVKARTSPTMPASIMRPLVRVGSTGPGGRTKMKKTNSRITQLQKMKRPNSSPDLTMTFNGATQNIDRSSVRRSKFGGVEKFSQAERISQRASTALPQVPRPTGQHVFADSSRNKQKPPCAAVFDLRVNHYNIKNSLQQKMVRKGGYNSQERKWPTTELREAIKCRLAEEEYDNFTQLCVGTIRADCEEALNLEVGALRAHPDFLQILAEEAQKRTDELNQELLLGDLDMDFSLPLGTLGGHEESAHFTKIGTAGKTAFASGAFGKSLSDRKFGVCGKYVAKESKSLGKEKRRRTSDDDESEDARNGKKGEVHLRDPSWIAAFGRLRQDGEVHREEIGRALEIVGFERPVDEWIEKSVRSAIGNTATMNQDEFCRVLQNYVEHQKKAWKVEFDTFDQDNSDSIDENELAHLIQNTGTFPFPDVLAEILEEVDETGDGSLSFDEFVQVLDLLRKRKGFTKREVNEFYSVFERYRIPPSHEISTGALQGILNWLGYSPEANDVEALVSETDADGSGKINKTEFLQAMRIYREREVARIRAFFANNDVDESGTLAKVELLVLMEQLGHTIRDDVLTELAWSVGADDEENMELTFESFWMLLKLFRVRCGYLEKEMTDLKEVFLRYATSQGQPLQKPVRAENPKPGKARMTVVRLDKDIDIDDPDLEMGTLQLGKALRWMGYATTLEQQQAAVNEIDVDGSGALTFSEFSKLMRRWDDQCLEKVKHRFERADTDNDGFIGPHCSSELSDTLRDLGHNPAKMRVYEVVEERYQQMQYTVVDIVQFEKLVADYREADRIVLRDTAGFQENAVQRFRHLFEKYDKDRSGDIDNGELARLLGDVFPASMTSLAERRRLQQLLLEVDVNGDGRLDFGDFLLMMRQYQDRKDEEQLEKERIAVEECKFTRPEVEQFRSIFHGSTAEGASFGTSSSMSLAEVRRVLSRVVPISEAQVGELSTSVKQVGKGATVVQGFPDFLRLMRKLQDENFANINNAAAEIAQREQNWYRH